MKKIAVFTGTRAEYGLLYWIMKDIGNDPDLELQLLVSGSHLSPEFGETYKHIERDGFQIAEKVEMLLSSDTSVGTVKSMGLGLIGFADALQRMQPDCLVLLGDRYEALAMAQAAFLMRIPVVHLHGGEKTEGAYDDCIRHAITKLSTLHFTSAEEYRQRVIQMGEAPSQVHNVGAVGLDYLRRGRGKFMTVTELSQSLDFEIHSPFFLVTYHAATMADEPAEEVFGHILAALDNFEGHQVILTYPNADDGGRVIIRMLEDYASRNRQKAVAVQTLGQYRYLSAVEASDAVIGNSSSGIIEVPSLKVPTVNIGMRQAGRLASASVLDCGISQQEIVAAMQRAVQMKRSGEVFSNPYDQGGASERILKELKSSAFPGGSKSFHDIDFKQDSQ